MAWIAMLDRMSTMDRVYRRSHGVDTTCVLCKNDSDTEDHLFFECAFSSQIWKYLMKGMLSSQIWKYLMKGMLRNTYSNNWNTIVSMLTNSTWDRKMSFCVRYAFQATIYAVWREQNREGMGNSLYRC